MGDKIKTALELAMEKYNIKADDEGSLTEQQKKEIAEIRSFYQAKRAEIEILHQQDLKKLTQGDPKEYMNNKVKLEEQYLQDRKQLESAEQQKILAIRKRK